MDVRLGFFGSFNTVLCGSLTNDCEINFSFGADYFVGSKPDERVFS